MRIAIDALGIAQPGGGRSATLNLLQPLMALDQENEYLVFLDQPEACLAPYAERIRQVIAPTARRLRVRAWAQATWPCLLRRERVSLIHHTKNLITFLSPCPAVVTVHDLTILAHPELYPSFDVLYWRTLQRLSLAQVARIIAVSPLTARDLERYYGIPDTRIEVICEGIDDLFRPVAPAEVAEVRSKYGLPERYLLHVGSISPKKNLSTLVRAYRQLVQAGAFDGALVLVGRAYWKEGDPALNEAIAQEPQVGQVILTGAVPQEDLPALYSGAACFAFPSLHEGFGLVPLEALACGVPVVASRVGMIEQLAEGAALFLDDPTDTTALAAHLHTLLTNAPLRERLRGVGLQRAAQCSRREAARRTLALYRAVARA